MESPKTESSSDSEREALELTLKKAELIKIKEELKNAKDNTTQSWLDSRPLIDELERLKSGLSRAEERHVASDTLVSELETELQVMNTSIKSKKEEEVKASTMVNEINLALDQLRQEMERLKRYADEKRQSRLKLKRVLRVKRQKLLSLQLMLAAARKETEAYGASAEEAVRVVKYCSEVLLEQMGSTESTTTTTVQLNHEEYEALRKRAMEEDSVAEWRVSVAMEEKLAAEVSRNSALTKLKEVKSSGKIRNKKIKSRKVLRRREESEEEVEENDIKEVEVVTIMPEGPADLIVSQPNEDNRQVPRTRRTKTRNKKKRGPKNKTSIFRKMRLCSILNVFRKLFG